MIVSHFGFIMKIVRRLVEQIKIAKHAYPTTGLGVMKFILKPNLYSQGTLDNTVKILPGCVRVPCKVAVHNQYKYMNGPKHRTAMNYYLRQRINCIFIANNAA